MRILKALGILLAVGCGGMDPEDTTRADIESWYCMNDPPQMVDRDPDRVQYILPVIDFNSQEQAPTPIAGLEIKVCTNPTCEPEFPRCGDVLGQCYQLGPGPLPFLTVVGFPYGLRNGVLRLTAPGYVPTDYMLGGPMVGTSGGEMTVQNLGVAMVPEATRDSLYSQVGLPGVDPERGALVARTLDCQGARAAGVRVESVKGDVELPAVAFALSSNNYATPTILETDERGIAGFVNLLPQTIDITAKNPRGEDYVRPTTVNVRAGVLTFAELRFGLEQWGQ